MLLSKPENRKTGRIGKKGMIPINIPVNKRTIGLIVLAASGITAFVAPLMLHSPTSNANSGGPGINDNGGGQNTQGQNPSPVNIPSSSPHQRRTMKDLADRISSCSSDNHGSQQSLMAKVNAATHNTHSTRTKNPLNALTHELSTPAAAKHHDAACVSELRGIINELRNSA